MNTPHELRRILILDDSSDYRKLLRKRLEAMFDGTEIVEYDPLSLGAPGDDFDWSKYDVLILDYQLNLPGITGLDIFQKYKKKDSFPATIMLTGAGTEELALKVHDYGIYNFFDKHALAKEALKTAIIEALNKNRQVRKRMLEQINQSQAFNKALFYQKLENPLQGPGDTKERVLLLIRLDNHKQIEEKFGLLISDNIIRHITKNAFELFLHKKFHPSITQLGESTIALITDYTGGIDELNKLLQEVCTDLNNNQYKYDGKDFNHKISMGAVILSKEKIPANILIKTAVDEVILASEDKENSYHVASKAAMSTMAHIPAQKPEHDVKPTAVKPGSTDELILDNTQLDLAGLKIKQAIEEKRLVQTYSPMISLSSDESGSEAFFLFSQLIDRDGVAVSADKVRKEIKTPTLQKYFDRWMLREALGKIVNNQEKHKYFFIMHLSEASLADTTLFEWLRRLLTGLEGSHPGKSVALEISAHDFFNLQKQSTALMNYLHKSHGFHFALGALTDIQEITSLPGDPGFDYIRTDKTLLKAINATPPPEQKQGSLLNYMKSHGIKFIVDGIIDSTGLTDAIVTGADYALGDFIGTATEQLDENKYMESFEIT